MMLNQTQLQTMTTLLKMGTKNDLPAIPWGYQYEFLWGAFYGVLYAKAWHYDDAQEEAIRDIIA